MTSSPLQSSAGDSLPPSRPSLKRPSIGLNVGGDKSGSPDVVSQLPSFLHRGPKPWVCSSTVYSVRFFNEVTASDNRLFKCW